MDSDEANACMYWTMKVKHRQSRSSMIINILDNATVKSSKAMKVTNWGQNRPADIDRKFLLDGNRIFSPTKISYSCNRQIHDLDLLGTTRSREKQSLGPVG